MRCTQLWRALPDGSRPSLLLEAPGVASPTFSPDARTIAFLRHGSEIWLTSADGLRQEKVGTISNSGISIADTPATGLTWSPDGRHLAFALMTPGEDMWAGAGSVWKLELRTGEISRQGSGWPSPSWQGKNLVFSGWSEEEGPTLFNVDHRSRRLSRHGAPYSASFNNGGWYGSWDKGVVVLREDDGELILGFSPRPWSRKETRTISPPSGYAFTRHSRASLSQDVKRLTVDLIGHGGDSVVGLYEIQAETWTILQYAWDPVTSPAPTVTGPIQAKRAVFAIQDLMASAPRATSKAKMLLGGSVPTDLFPRPRSNNYVIGDPEQRRDGWTVPVTVHGRYPGGYAYRDLTARVRETNGRLDVDVEEVTPLERIETITDAISFLHRSLPHLEISAPSGLPPGARLDMRMPVQVSSYKGFELGTIRFKLSGGNHRYMAFAYGDVSFSIGCGGASDVENEEVNGSPAVSGRSGNVKQILWPATKKTMDAARATIYGTLPREALVEMARSL